MLIKHSIPTLTFYVLSAIAVIILEKLVPTGPCNPGLGILLFLALIPIVLFLFIRNIYRAMKGKKECKIAATIHCIAVVVAIFLLW